MPRVAKRKRELSLTASYPHYEIEDSPEPKSRKPRLSQTEWVERSIARSHAYNTQRLGLSRVQSLAALAMPIKRGKKRAAPKGIGATARAKNAWKKGGISDRQIVAAVKKVESKSLETYYANFGCNYYSLSAAVTSGSNAPGGFLSASGATSGTFAQDLYCSITNMSPQIQVGTAAGYRKGQFVNPIGFRFWLSGHMSAYAGDHTFYMTIARYKGGSIPNATMYPMTMALASVSLYEAGAFGVNASGFMTANDGTSIVSSRFNRDVWDIKKVVSWKVPYQKTAESSASPQTTFQKNGYYKFPAQAWDFTSYSGANATGSTCIKGGDYYIILYQVGNEPNTNASHSFMFNYELSYKDA